jgi:5-methylcytosine-specific restriction protein B
VSAEYSWNARAVWAAMTVLAAAPDRRPLPFAQVWVGVQKLDPTLEEEWWQARSMYGGRTTAKVKMRYESINLVKAGWLHKHDRVWELTGPGRKALDRHQDDKGGLLAEAYELYTLWSRYRSQYEEACRLLGVALLSSSWVPLRGLAEYVDIDTELLAQFLQGSKPYGWYLALDDIGHPRGLPLYVDELEMDAWQQALTEAAAHGPLRWRSADELAELGRSTVLPQQKQHPQRRAWLLRDAEQRDSPAARWLDRRECTLASERLVVLAMNDDESDIYQRVDEAYPNLSAARRANLARALHTFLTRMQENDLLVAIDGNQMLVGRITGSARVEPWRGGSLLARDVDWADGVDESHLRYLFGGLGPATTAVEDVSHYLGDLGVLLDEDSDQEPIDEPDVATLPDTDDALLEALTMHDHGDWVQDLVELLRDRPQMVFQGPPGTGKTHLARALAMHLTRGQRENISLVQFHPSYGYEDFVEGFRPRQLGITLATSSAEEKKPSPDGVTLSEGGGAIVFDKASGPLLRLADKARGQARETFVLIIDEINRGDVARIFGELYFLLEYRDESIELMNGGGTPFRLPPNLVILGTMNNADRSITPMDGAMRRRFWFVDMHPDKAPVDAVLGNWLDRHKLSAEAALLLNALNRRLRESSAQRDDPGFRIGPSYLMQPAVHTHPRGLERVWEYQILPLLEELHWADEFDVITQFGLVALRGDLRRLSR